MMRTIRALSTIISAMASLIVGACAPQPRLQISWYLDDPQIAVAAAHGQAPPPAGAPQAVIAAANTGADPGMTLFIANRGPYDLWLAEVVITGEVAWPVPGGHYVLPAYGGFATVPFPLPSVGADGDKTTCRIPVELSVFWGKGRASSAIAAKPRRSRPYRIEGKLPSWLLESWVTRCSLAVPPRN